MNKLVNGRKIKLWVGKRQGRNENKMESNRRWKEETGAVIWSERNSGSKTGEMEREETMNKSLITYLLTAWCRVLLEKLTDLQLVKKFPAFQGAPRFITALTSVRHLSLSWASPIQSIYPHPTSWRSILILFTHLRLGLPSGLFPPGFPTKTLYTPLFSPPYALHAPPISFFSILPPAQYLVNSTEH